MISEFTQIPSLDIGGDGQWILTDELHYNSAILDATIIVPQGFETDLASIPPIFTPIHPKNGKHRPAAIVHDYLCRRIEFDRRKADQIFHEAMELLDVAKWRRWSFYLAVRVGAIWNKIKRGFK